MTDVFNNKSVLPMLLSIADPFDSPDYIFELKLDGFRCIAYCNGDEVCLKSRNGLDFTHRFLSLCKIGRNVKGRCILDGELVALKGGKPNRGALFLGGGAALAVFDIIYADGQPLFDTPLIERKKILIERVSDCNELTVCGHVQQHGKAYFDLIKAQGLEGIIAKRKLGLYHCGKRTREWLKIKNTDYV